jgi:hypothetical protein
MAKSSMVASTIPKNPIYHGKRDASHTHKMIPRRKSRVTPALMLGQSFIGRI